MKTHKTYLALLIAAAVGLTGCLDDALDDTTGTNPPPVNPDPGPDPDPDPEPGEPLNITFFGQDASQDFTLWAALGSQAAMVGTDALPNGITVTTDLETQEQIQFTRSAEATETAQLLLQDQGSGHDFTDSLFAGEGVLAFEMQVTDLEMIDDGNGNLTAPKVAITLASEDGTQAEVDITSVARSLIANGQAAPSVTSSSSRAGGSYQPVHIPLSCFSAEEAGIDITAVEQPFALSVNSAADIKVRNIEFIAKGKGKQPGVGAVLECVNDSELLTASEADSTIFKRRNKTNNGWGINTPNPNYINGNTSFKTIAPVDMMGIWAKPFDAAKPQIPYYDVNNPDNKAFYFATSLYDITKATPPLIEVVNDQGKVTPALHRKDISQYLENGELQFLLNVDKLGDIAGQIDELAFTVQLNTPQPDDKGKAPAGAPSDGYQPSFKHRFVWDLNSDTTKLYQVNIPLKALFTAEDGTIDLNSVQHVDQVVFTPEFVSNQDPAAVVNIEDFRVYFADVMLVNNEGTPGTGEPVLYVPPAE